jgi:hypothetical protein
MLVLIINYQFQINSISLTSISASIGLFTFSVYFENFTFSLLLTLQDLIPFRFLQ